MLSYFLDNPRDRDRVLGLLLGERDAAVRLCRYLAFSYPGVGGPPRSWFVQKV
jgi:hypothetical protein